MPHQTDINMLSSGDHLLETIASAYEYTPPRRGNAVSAATTPYAPPLAPSLDRLPAFIIQVNDLDKRLAQVLAHTLHTDLAKNTFDLEAMRQRCARQLDDQSLVPDFSYDELMTVGDSASVASRLISHVRRFMLVVYGNTIRVAHQHRIPDQTLDHLVSNRDSGIIWEDESWMNFEECALQIIALANSQAGKQLQRQAREEHGRAMLYKLAVAMFDCNLHWGLLFGGDNALLFQRCTLEHQPQRYGLLCSGILQIDRFFVTILGMLLVPGDRPLVNMAELAISVPSAYSPGDNQALVRAKRKALGYTAEDNHSQEQGMIMISTALNLHVWFSMSGHEFMTLQLSRSTAIHSSLVSSAPDSPPLPTPCDEEKPSTFIQKGLEGHFAAIPLPLQRPVVATLPVLLVHERMSAGGTGVVFAGTIGALALIIKTIPPGVKGEADLRHEHHIYSVLASLHGRVLPRMYGLFEGEGWIALVIEHCGDKVSDIHQLSLQQRETLWRHALAIHASGVRHADLELRNMIVSKSGELRIVDFAFSEVGHECEGLVCPELSDFRGLLELPAVS